MSSSMWLRNFVSNALNKSQLSYVKEYKHAITWELCCCDLKSWDVNEILISCTSNKAQ